MRTAMLALVCVVCVHTMNAQFSLLPQVGFENSKTVINHNGMSTFSPRDMQFTPQASLRLNYLTKLGHGVFVGVATSRSVVLLMVDNPENVLGSVRTQMGNMQARLEGGYQFSTPKINLSKSKAREQTAQPTTRHKTYYRCGGYSRSRTAAEKTKSKSVSWMRFQPSIGMAMMPSVQDNVVIKSQGYEYRAGNWNTALLTGANIEFGKNNRSLLTVSVNYFNGMGNLGKQVITTEQAGKSTITILQSDVSGWNLKVGIPLSFTKSNASKAKETKINKLQKPSTNKCGQYRVSNRCGRII
jgi:hypothetical protein